MASTANKMRTVVATGASSGLGLEVIKQLLVTPQPYRFILGARDVQKTQASFNDAKYDTAKHSLTVLPLELSKLRDVKTFAQQTLERLGQDKLDYLFLNAAIANGTQPGDVNGSDWCQAYIVNHISQHYLIHLLREKLVASESRIVVVSSGAVRAIRDNNTSLLESDLKTSSGQNSLTIYPASKFVQLLGAQWWRRELMGTNTVVAVSPGMIPGTGLGRGRDDNFKPDMSVKDAKSVEEGAQSLIAAMMRDDIPKDPEQMFLTSWGEWWPKDVYQLALDKALQEKFSPSKEEIEKTYNITA